MNYSDKTTLVETVRDLDKSKAELSNSLSRLNKALIINENYDIMSELISETARCKLTHGLANRCLTC